MKIKTATNSRMDGSVLLISLGLTFVIGMLLASYLVLTGVQHTSVVRAQSWNASIVLSEAGVEDALSLVNKNVASIGHLADWTNSVGVDNWSILDDGTYYVRRTLANGYYDVYVTNNVSDTNGPTIISYGAVNSYAATIDPFYAQVGGNAPTTTLSRGLQVLTIGDGKFTAALAAVDTIDFKGNNVATDSFDAASTNYSNGGLYPYGFLFKTKANGNVYTDATITNSINFGNANIKGHVKTGPRGTVSIGANGSVGDRPWVESGTYGIKPGYFAPDFNAVFPPVELPSTTWSPVPPGMYKYNGTDYHFVINSSGDYYIDNFSKTLYIKAGLYVRLLMTGNINMSGSDAVCIDPAGSVVEVYVDTPNFSTSGSAGFYNNSGRTQNLYVFGTTNCTAFALSGNAPFTGGLYAPNAVMTLGGGGSDTIDYIGAIVAYRITLNGKFNFHYDENMARVGPTRGYVPVNWKEL